MQFRLLAQILRIETLLIFGFATSASWVETRLATADDPSGLYSIAAMGGKPALVTVDDEKIGTPNWSPDGEFIAYDLFGPGKQKTASVVVMRKDGTEKANLGLGGMPSWSPDGKRVAFHTYSPSAVAISNRDGTDRQQVIDHWGNPRWMTDMDKILTIKRGGLAVFDFNTGEETIAIDPKWRATYGISVSPDDRYVAFSNFDGQLMIATLPNPFDQIPEVKTRLSAGKIQHTCWSPDGKQLAVGWRPPEKKRFQIYILDAHGDTEPKLVEGQLPDKNNDSPSWSPDGTTILYCRLPW